MGSILDKIKKNEVEYEKKFKDNVNYKKLNKYYNDMNSKGLVKPEKYNIPPIDTIGKRIFLTSK